MLRVMYKSKIQKATITDTKMDYAGSIGIDATLIGLADMLPNEKVQVLNLNTGARFETYVIKEPADSGIICLYGPAAHLGKVGEKIFIISYCMVEDVQARDIKPKVICVDENNLIAKERVKKNA
ncbi:MAG: aspartate 1-decarboxylase [Candidatus Omnitrophica bacterium]|nr:aspartate 1-decarboxylase [Candidatus Omnitrophota bacterium]